MSRFNRNLASILVSQDLQLDPGISTITARIQLLYGAWVNMAQLAIGLALGFASVQIPQLSKSDSTIQITVVDASWIVSAVPLLVPAGCLISGFLMDWAGRRSTLIFSQVPMFVGWLYTALAKTPNDIIIARAITGVGCGMAMGPSRAYGIEISLPNMRGVIGAFPNLAMSLGITMTTALDNFFAWQTLCYISCVLTVINFCSFILLPETPYFILQTKTELEARDNLALFRGQNYNIEKEMNQLIDFKQENNLRKLSLMGCLGMLLTKTCCKPFTLMMIYNFISQAAGISFFLFWTIDLLEKTRSSFDLQTSNIMMGVTRVAMGTFASVLFYRFSRRSLAMISAIGVTIVCCTFGFILMSKDNPSIIPQICFMVYVVFASLGYYTLPFLMAFELYPLQVRGVLGGATISITSLMMFASTKLEPFMLDTLGVVNTFMIFGLFSLLGCIFIFFWLPETKDLTLQEIEEYYKEIRPTLSSQRRMESLNLLAELSGPSRQSKSKVLERLNYETASRSTMLAQLEAQKKLSALIEKELEEQLRNSTSDIGVRRTQRTEERAMDVRQYEDRDGDFTKSTDNKKYEERDREKAHITFSDENEAKNIDNESTKSSKSTDSRKSRLKVIYEGKKEKKDEKKKDDTPKDDKREEDSPKDEDQPSSSKKNTQ